MYDNLTCLHKNNVIDYISESALIVHCRIYSFRGRNDCVSLGHCLRKDGQKVAHSGLKWLRD